MKLEPDVILMDVAMPGLGGLEATREIRRLVPRAKLLVLTQYSEPEYDLLGISVSTTSSGTRMNLASAAPVNAPPSRATTCASHAA